MYGLQKYENQTPITNPYNRLLHYVNSYALDVNPLLPTTIFPPGAVCQKADLCFPEVNVLSSHLVHTVVLSVLNSLHNS
jgi:hypothetical protein